MIRLITQLRIMKILVCMLAVSQLIACGGGGESNTTTGASTLVSTGTPQSSTLSLNWVAPVTRTDGSPISLAEIEGYKVYIGTSTGNYTDIVNISDGSQTSVTITGILNGTYYVAMTTYDTGGLESGYSPEILKATQ
jgi:hypothetical protein